MGLAAGTRLGPYEIIAPLGAGGMGEVWRARDVRVDRVVALKVLPEDLLEGKERRSRFEREAKLLASLNHPAIATLYSFEEIEGRHILTMELLEGQTLRERLRDGPLGLGRACDLGAQIASGLAAAHEKGIVHRDLKPENLFLTREGRIKILDFGVAKRAADTDAGADERPTDVLVTGPGVVLGTTPYMSPEQIRGKSVDGRSDVFSLGSVLYEMLTGSRAFEGQGHAETMAAILVHEPVPIAERLENVPPELVRILDRCLAKEPDTRYHSAHDLAADLAALATRPSDVWSMPTSPVRTPAWAGLKLRRALLVVVPVVAALAVGFWLARPKPALSFAPRDWVLVADVQNETGDPIFDRSLFTALTVSLEQSRFANVYPRSRVAAALTRMRKDPAARLDEDVAREVCVRENVRALVTCAIARAGSRYVLAARLVDPKTGESVRSFEEQAKGQDAVLPALSALAGRIRESLGESLPAIRNANRPLPSVTTASLPALRQYADGQLLWVKGNYRDAVSAYERALAEDPAFAMALAALGNAYMSHIFNESAKGLAFYEKALQLSSRTTDRERQLIEASVANARGDVDGATRLYRVYLSGYPDDSSVRYTLASILMQNRRYAEALDEFREVVRIAPTGANAWINMASSLKGLQRYPDALVAYGKAFALEPSWETSGNLNHEYGMTLVASGDAARARAVFEKALALPDMRSRALRSLALLDLSLGRYRDAAPRLKEAILANEASRARLSASRDHIFLATLLAGEGDRKGQLAELERARALQDGLDAGAGWPAQLGVEFARVGGWEKARDLRERAAAKARTASASDMALLHRLEGEIELAQGRVAPALEKLRLSDHEFRTGLTLESVARAASLAGNLPEAVSTYEALVASNELGWEAQQNWVEAPYFLALAYRALGQTEKARAAADLLLARWKDADPDLVVLRKARTLRRELGP